MSSSIALPEHFYRNTNFIGRIVIYGFHLLLLVSEIFKKFYVLVGYILSVNFRILKQSLPILGLGRMKTSSLGNQTWGEVGRVHVGAN